MENLAHHLPLRGRRLGQHRVERRMHRRPQAPEQRQHVAACLAAKDAVLMLQGDDVHVGKIQKIGRPLVGRDVLIGALEPYLLRIGMGPAGIVHRDDEGLGAGQMLRDGAPQVAGVGGDAAPPRHVVADERDPVELGIGKPRRGR